MSVKIKKSVFKAAVKEVVRECLNERCGGGGHLSGGKKGERMFKHIKQGYRGEKDPETASRIAAATVNKNLGEAGLTSEMGPESRDSALDDVVRFVIKKAPVIKDPEKLGRVVSLLFKHQMGYDADPDALQQSIAKHWRVSDTASPTTPTEEGEEFPPSEDDVAVDATAGHDYDEKEEIMLIKVMKKCAEKLEAMHAGMPGAEEEPEVEVEPEEEPEGGEEAPPFGGGEEEPSEPEGGEEAPPFGGGEEEPSEEPEEPETEKPEGDDDDDDRVDEESFKTVAPRAYEVAADNKARTIQTDPKVNETTNMKMGPQYKTASPRQARVQSDDQARRIQFDPKMTEAKKKVKENHKVQKRSYKTVQDVDNDPANVRDPDVPQA